jgi:excisionase family DNA binding protein
MITIKELAQAVGVAPKTARNWLDRHSIPRQKSGGRVLIPRSTIRTYRACQRRMWAKPLTAADVPSALVRALRRRVKPVGSCRVWTGNTDINGYGTFVYSEKLIVHRAAWVLTHGPLKAGERVGPTCGHPACIEHLEVRRTTSD